MIVIDVLSSTYNGAKKWACIAYKFVCNFPEFYKQKLVDGKKLLAAMRFNMKNFHKTNMDLGLYHLNHGNLFDAIMRFKVVEKFIDPEDPALHHWLGWCYFLKKNYIKSASHLKMAGKEDIFELGKFVTNADSIQEMPQKMRTKYRELSLHLTNKDLPEYSAMLTANFVNKLLNEVEELPKNCHILELGCKSGAIGATINYKVEGKYHITGVEELEILESKAKVLSVYDSLKIQDFNSFLSSNKVEHNIVIAFNSLNFETDLVCIFKQVNEAMKTHGYFAILLKNGKKTIWDKTLNEFVYSPEDVKKQLKLAKFKLVGTSEFMVNKKIPYTMFICNKSN